MKHLLTLNLLTFVVSLSIAQTKTTILNYATDKSDLTVEHLDQLEQFIEDVNYDKVGLINIFGHTDTVASKTYNIALSLKRASKAEAFFLSRGFEPSLITKNWFGENQARSPGNLLEDRRVVIEIFYKLEESPKQIIATPKPIEPEIIIPDLSDFYALVKETMQEFCIPYDKDTLIVGAKGTIIDIKAGSFNLTEEQRKRNSCVRFQLKEAFLKSEMILENLSTTSDGRILETQGMTYTNAMIDEDTLSLLKDIVILLPTDTVMPGLKVMDGQRDPHTDVMNWIVDNNSTLRNFKVMDVAKCMQQAQGWSDCMGNFWWHKCDYCKDGCDTLVWIDLEQLRKDCANNSGGFLDELLYVDCDRCKFFFCKIERFPKQIQGLFNKEVRYDNKWFRLCQKKYNRKFRLFKKRKRHHKKKLIQDGLEMIQEKAEEGIELTEREKEILEIAKIIEQVDSLIINRREMVKKEMVDCAELDALFDTYNVGNREDLILALNKPLMDEFGVSTIRELMDTLPNANLDEIEVAYKNKKISYSDYKFYIFNASTLGWKNLDVFAKIPPKDMVKVNIPIRPSKHVDFKLVFIDREFVIPSKPGIQSYYFENMPKGENAWIVGIKYLNGTPMLAMKSITVKNKNYNVEFKELSLEELKEQLKILDFNSDS